MNENVLFTLLCVVLKTKGGRREKGTSKDFRIGCYDGGGVTIK